MKDNIESSIPNVFYDLLVFVSPSVLLVVGVIVGLECMPLDILKKYGFRFDTINFILIILGFIFLGYEYGRLAETLSSPFVGGLIKWFAKRKILFTNSDFNADLTKEVDSLQLPGKLDAFRKGSKWTIYFYAIYVTPDLGRDLLKRYAWEKLSRSSAFTFAILFLTSLIVLLLNICHIIPADFDKFGFGSIILTLSLFLLCVATYFEYYQRNCWNNDLLCKTLPILVLGGSHKSPREK